MSKRWVVSVVLVLIFFAYLQEAIKQAVRNEESVEKAIERHEFFKKAWIRKN